METNSNNSENPKNINTEPAAQEAGGTVINSEPETQQAPVDQEPEATGSPETKEEKPEESQFSFSTTDDRIKIPTKGLYYYWKKLTYWLKTMRKSKIKFNGPTRSFSPGFLGMAEMVTPDSERYNTITRDHAEVLQLNITNDTETKQEFSLFNNKNANVKVEPTVSHLTYERFIELMKYEGPFECQLIRIQSYNSAQIVQLITLRSENASGCVCEYPMYTQNYFSAYQFQSGIIDIHYPITIDVALQMLCTALANTSFTITLFKSKKDKTLSSYSSILNAQGYIPKPTITQAPKPTRWQKFKAVFKNN